MNRNGIALIVGAVFLAGLWAAVSQGGDTQPSSADMGGAEPLPETFVLTPIRREVVDAEVPAAVLGPLTNNSCSDWKTRTESCYLPACVLKKQAGGPPGADRLLEQHLSSMVGAWKAGAWPVCGDSVTFDLKQYSTMEHLWLATRIELTESIGDCRLTDDQQPIEAVLQASAKPVSTLQVEVFDGARGAMGYPRKTKF
jgi:hypothetical protein